MRPEASSEKVPRSMPSAWADGYCPGSRTSEATRWRTCCCTASICPADDAAPRGHVLESALKKSSDNMTAM